MRVGIVAPPWIPVPPPRYGGTEAIIDCLARGLTRLGHDVRLFTIGESRCPVDRRWRVARPASPLGGTPVEAAHVIAAYEELEEADVIHDHTVIGPLVAARWPGLPPVVVTNHGPFTSDARLAFRQIATTASVVAVSQAQRAGAPDVPVAAVIPDGVDLERYSPGDGGGDHLIFVGRMSADKGVHRAIRVARRAGRRIVVVTTMRPGERAYFDQVVRPVLGPDVDLLEGPTPAERIGALRAAVALLNPITWPEPFGLVMAESLACGTPVLAFPRGSAGEIVDHGRTGYLCADETAMVQAVAGVGELDRSACRAAAEERFDMARMAADYARLYEAVCADAARRTAVRNAATT